MKIIYLTCAAGVMAMCSSPAHAQDAPSEVISSASVSIEDCKKLLGQQVEHTPGDDVAFKPGVDVDGNPVVPAEGDQVLGEIKLPDEIVIDFGLDFAGRYGISGAGLYTATAGILTIHYDLALGGLTVNGKPLNKADSRAVIKACTLMLRDAAAAQPADKPGQ